MRKEGLLKTKINDEEEFKSMETIETIDEEESVIKNWLKYNTEPIDDIYPKWKKKFQIRKNLLRGNHSLQEIIEEWPLYKQSFGYILVLLKLFIYTKCGIKKNRKVTIADSRKNFILYAENMCDMQTKLKCLTDSCYEPKILNLIRSHIFVIVKIGDKKQISSTINLSYLILCTSTISR